MSLFILSGGSKHMKFECSKKELVNKINIAKLAIPSKTTMSILQYIYIEAQEGVIRFYANDMENGIETVLNGDILEEGNIAIEAAKFASAVSGLPDENLILFTNEKMELCIKSQKSEIDVYGREGEDFTFPPTVEKIDAITVHQKTLKKFITQTCFSVSKNDANKIMTGALLELQEDTLSLCALDGHRIAVRKTLLSPGFPTKKAIIYGKSLNKLAQILSDDSEKEVSIYITDHYAGFEIEDTFFITRLIDGTFFDISQMMSGDYETKINLNRLEFKNIIKQAQSISSESEKKPLILTIKDENNMNVQINSMTAKMDANIDISKQGKDIQIGFNPTFLKEALDAIEDEMVDIYFVNSKAPCFIRNTDSSYLYMILPINFKPVE